ncbi:MAG TPA: hypothetical protein VF516_31775 [Kofleriaceae bacterium]
MSIILGCNADIYSAFIAAIPGSAGCRSYQDDILYEPGDVPATFPGAPGSRVVASIRPYPEALLFGSLDRAILAMLRDGAARFTAPQLTAWHEAGHLYQDLPYLTPAVVRLVHAKMQDLCNQVPGVEYGCVVHGDISTMDKWIPYAPDALDWYGIDVYWNDPFDFSIYDQLKAYLDGYRTLAQHRTGLLYPRINVCAANSHDESRRPGLFKNVARWLHHHGGSRMLTSYQDGDPSGGPWAPGDTDTINALKYIAASYVHPQAGSERRRASFWEPKPRLS